MHEYNRFANLEFGRNRELLYPFETIQFLGPREMQQDFYGAAVVEQQGKKYQINAVADGHGENGDLYAEKMVDDLIEELKQAQQPIAESFFKEIFAELDRRALALEESGGTTLSVVVLGEGEIVGAYVGDSEVKLVGTQGKMTELTFPHRFTSAEEVERLREEGVTVPDQPLSRVQLAKASATLTNNRLYHKGSSINISRAFGDAMFKPYLSSQPETFSGKLEPNDKFLLIASDGFWELGDDVEEQQAAIEEALASAASAADAAMKLRALIAKWQQHDNITLQIIELKKSE